MLVLVGCSIETGAVGVVGHDGISHSDESRHSGDGG